MTARKPKPDTASVVAEEPKVQPADTWPDLTEERGAEFRRIWYPVVERLRAARRDGAA